MHLRHFIALLLLLLPFAITKAEERHVTDIKEKHELIAKRRPPEREVAGARKIVDRLDPSLARVYNTMRILGHGDVRLREDPYVHGRVGLPPLGELEPSPEHQPDSWVVLRLLALMRAGYPSEPVFKAEIENWLLCARPLRRHDWADASLELLTLHALLNRDDPLLAGVHESARKRANEIAGSRNWDIEAPEEPSLYTITKQCHYVMARHVTVTNGWREVEPGCADEIIDQLEKALDDAYKKPLWLDIPEDQDAPYYRALMIMAALCGAVESDESLERATRRNAGQCLKRIKERMPPGANKQDGWRCFKGDAMVMTLSGGESIGRKNYSEIQDNVGEYGLGRCRHVFGLPRPHNNHIAAGLRWVLCRCYGDPGMGRDVIELEDRDTAAALCMALAAHGGPLYGPPAKPLGWGDSVSIFTALKTLDLDDYYGYMLKTDLAIDASAQWLLDKQGNNGRFAGGNANVLGGHGLAVHALLDAGVSRDHPQLKKAWQEFLRMVRVALPKVEGREGGRKPLRMSHANYSCSIALMTWQSYYEPEIRKSGMYEATTYESYHKARAKLWRQIPEGERELIAEISWRLSNADGYGWSYQLFEKKTPIPDPITVEPEDDEDKPEGPVTGEKAEEKNAPPEIEDERARRTREGKFPERPVVPKHGVRHGDNSNSQYSVLGLKAAMTLGAPMDVKTLAWEAGRLMGGMLGNGYAERLMNPTRLMTLEQLEKQSEKYADSDDPNDARLRPTIHPYRIGGWSYFCNGTQTWGSTENKKIGEDEDGNPIYQWPYSVAMTAAGISSLAIIRDALMISEIYDPQLIAKIDDCVAGGVYALGLKYPYNRDYFKIDATQTEAWVGGGEGFGMLYDMYSCERAGVLTGKVYFANTEWYRDGADLLMKEQNRDGGWKPLDNQVCNSSWAILFLKRSAPYLATQQPPRPKPSGPVTGK